MMPLKEWLNSPEIKEIRKKPIGEHFEMEFSRNPFRAIHYRRDLMYSPADGVIVYAKEVSPYNDLVSIKGKPLTVREIIGDSNYKDRSIVVGIMMTVYDVHYNVMPTSGILYYSQLPALKIENLTMTKIEASLLKGEEYNPDDMEYMFYNERQICEIYSPQLRQKYYIAQVADFEVDVIANYYPSGIHLKQGVTFSLVTYGSQVDLIVPIKPYNKYELLVKDKVMWHVEAGIDALVRVVPK